MCIGSTVTIRSPIRARGSGGMLPRGKFDKMVRSGAIWAFQSMLLPRKKSTILRLIN